MSPTSSICAVSRLIYFSHGTFLLVHCSSALDFALSVVHFLLSPWSFTANLFPRWTVHCISFWDWLVSFYIILRSSVCFNSSFLRPNPCDILNCVVDFPVDLWVSRLKPVYVIALDGPCHEISNTFQIPFPPHSRLDVLNTWIVMLIELLCLLRFFLVSEVYIDSSRTVSWNLGYQLLS